MNKDKPVILLVDDEPDVIVGTGRALIETGYRIIEARNGFEGLRALKLADNRVDLILTDIRMPGMNGIEFIQAQRASGPLIPVIFYTGGVFYRDEVDHISHLPRSIFMYKPFDIDALHHDIQALINLSQAAV